MFDAIRDRLAYRAALKAERNRLIGEWPTDPHEARILLVLPDDESMLRAAWKFALQIDIPRTNLIPVVLGEQVRYAPDSFAGAVDVISDKDRDWRKLPGKKAQEAFWNPHPHVAIDLSSPFSSAAGFLAGASPAHFRFGLYDKAAEPFYDVLLAPTDSFESALVALRGYLESIEPPVIAFI